MMLLSFLFRFEILSNGIDLVLNREIALDMYADIDEKLKPLAHACCETLVRYKHLSISRTSMERLGLLEEPESLKSC